MSIKGYYYEAEIMGEKVVWVVPHKFGHKVCPDHNSAVHFVSRVVVLLDSVVLVV